MEELIEDLRRRKFRPGRHAKRYRLDHKVVLHVCGAALTAGLLIPDREKKWIPGRSSAMLAEPSAAVALLLTLVIAPVVIAAAGFWPGEPDNGDTVHPLVWWGPTVLLVGAVLVCAGPVRRVLPWPLFSVVALVALGLGLAVAGTSMNIGDVAIAALTAVPTAAVTTGLAWARRDEMFYDEVARFQAGEVYGPGLALRHRVEHAVPSTRSQRKRPTGPSSGTSDGRGNRTRR